MTSIDPEPESARPPAGGLRVCGVCGYDESGSGRGTCQNCGAPLPRVWQAEERPSTSAAPAVPDLVNMDRVPEAATPGISPIQITNDVWGEAAAIHAPAPETPASLLPNASDDPWSTHVSSSESPRAPVATGAESVQAQLDVPRRLRLTNPDQVVPITSGAGVLLGRLPPSVIADHPAVSSYVSASHARIQVDLVDPGIVWLVDEGSTNGTLLNGVSIRPHVRFPLAVGDRIQLTRMNPVILEVLP